MGFLKDKMNASSANTAFILSSYEAGGKHTCMKICTLVVGACSTLMQHAYRQQPCTGHRNVGHRVKSDSEYICHLIIIRLNQWLMWEVVPSMQCMENHFWEHARHRCSIDAVFHGAMEEQYVLQKESFGQYRESSTSLGWFHSRWIEK